MSDNSTLVNNQDWLNPDFKDEIEKVKRVIQETMVEFHNNDFKKYIANYKKYLQFTGDRLQWLLNWQSNTDYPLVSSVVDTMFGNIFDFWYEFWINDPVIKRICNDAFDFRWAGKEAFREISKEILIVWKAFSKDYLIKEDCVDTFFDREIKTQIKVPSIQYVSVFDVMYDRSKGIKNSPFKIIRTFMTGEQIQSKYRALFLYGKSEDQIKIIDKKIEMMLKKFKESTWTRFSSYDYNPVKMLTSISQLVNSWKKDYSFDIPLVDAKTINRIWDSWTLNDEDKNNYFLETNQSNYEVIDYTTSNKRYLFINWNLFWYGKRIKWIGEIQEASFSNIPWTWNANGVADNLGWLQDIQASLWNAFIDNIKLILGPMFKISWNVPIGKDGTIDFRKFRAIKTTGQNDIEKIQLGVTDFAPINFMQMVQSVSEQRSGVNNYVMWGQWTIERVSGGIDMKYNQYKSKLTPITDSIDQIMGNTARAWIMYLFKFFTKEELAKLGVTIEEKIDDKWQFETILVNKNDIRDYLDERNITFTYNSLHRLTKENSRADIKEALPFILQYASDKINFEELIKVLTWQDFDPDAIVRKQEDRPATPPGGYTDSWTQVIAQDNPWTPQQLSDDEILQQIASITQ